MPQIKMSEIRDKFPMYGDIPDEKLVIALHKKYYSDIPIEQFNKAIDYDTARADPTEGMSTLDKFRAGLGKGMTDVARGIGQAVGLVSREDIANARELEAPLMKTGAGKAGNIAGTVAALAPTALIPGANTLAGAGVIGAGTGALAPSTSTEETIKNTLLGGAMGPASVMLGRGLSAAAQSGKALIEPFTKAGQERIAARTLQQFASNPEAAAKALQSAETFVQGSIPTMAQASGDAGLAQLERTLANNPESGKLLSDAFAAQRGARLSALEGVSGDAAKMEAAKAARAAGAKPLYDQAVGATYKIDDQLGSLLSRPAVQKALVRAENLAANEGRAAPLVVQNGKPVGITGQGLQDLKMAMDDMVSDPLAGIAANEARGIKNIRNQVESWFESANPAYKQANQAYAEASKPINTMQIAQELQKRLEPALARYGATTQEHAAAYAKALEAAKDSVKKITGQNKSMDEVVDKEAAKILEGIAKDMGRKVNAENLGRAAGSNTAQNLAAQNLLRRTLGPTGLPQSWAESNVLQGLLSPYTGLAKLSGAEQRVLDRLAQASVNPADAAGLLKMAGQSQPRGLLGESVMPYLPATTQGLLANTR